MTVSKVVALFGVGALFKRLIKHRMPRGSLCPLPAMTTAPQILHLFWLRQLVVSRRELLSRVLLSPFPPPPALLTPLKGVLKRVKGGETPFPQPFPIACPAELK